MRLVFTVMEELGFLIAFLQKSFIFPICDCICSATEISRLQGILKLATRECSLKLLFIICTSWHASVRSIDEYYWDWWLLLNGSFSFLMLHMTLYEIVKWLYSSSDIRNCIENAFISYMKISVICLWIVHCDNLCKFCCQNGIWGASSWHAESSMSVIKRFTELDQSL